MSLTSQILLWDTDTMILLDLGNEFPNIINISKFFCLTFFIARLLRSLFANSFTLHISVVKKKLFISEVRP